MYVSQLRRGGARQKDSHVSDMSAIKPDPGDPFNKK